MSIICLHCARVNNDDKLMCYACGALLTRQAAASQGNRGSSVLYGNGVSAMPWSLQEEREQAPPITRYTPCNAEYAGFWQRVGAAIIDIFLLAVATIPFDLLIAPTLHGFGAGSASGLDAAAPLPYLILGCLYAAFMESSPFQATFGKLFFGIKVTDPDGNRISFSRATGRFFAKVLSAIPLFAGFCMAAFSEKNQSLHDRMAGTVVVHR